MRNNSYKDFDISLYGAVEQPDGSYLHNDGDVYWYNKVGQRHRKDGPAVISPNGDVEWWLNGNYYFVDDWLIELNKTDEEKMMLRLQYA